MTYEVRLTSMARRDRDHVVDWYDSEAPDQTERFLDEFYGVARRLAEFPQSGRAVHRGARRASLHIFPYQLWYRVRDEARVVEILAVLHYRQDPEGLIDRLGLQSGD